MIALWTMLAEGDSAALGRPGPSSIYPTIAAAAMCAGMLLVAYWWRRRLMKQGPSAPAQHADLARDMSELAERLACELDAKAERLERLLASAQARIAHLERLEAVAKLTTPAPQAMPDRFVEPRPRADSTHHEVYELADAGLKPVDIARRLDRPTGQIELILNLRRGTVSL